MVLPELEWAAVRREPAQAERVGVQRLREPVAPLGLGLPEEAPGWLARGPALQVWAAAPRQRGAPEVPQAKREWFQRWEWGPMVVGWGSPSWPPRPSGERPEGRG